MDYFENELRMDSNTKMGPVLPIIVIGCPENNEYVTPVIKPESKLSIAPYRLKTIRNSQISQTLVAYSP